jgi:amino acid transporter
MNWRFSPIEPFIAEDIGILEGVGGTAAICAWMYCGYESISVVAGEIKKPQLIPKALMICMPLVMMSYVLPTIAGLASVGQYENWATFSGEATVGYADVLTQNAGAIWGYLFLIIAIVSQCGIFNAYMASGSRGFFVLADDNLCPKFLTKVSKKRGVPYVGILSLTFFTILTAQFDFKTLVKAEVIFIMAIYTIMPPTIWVLRNKFPVDKRHGLFVISGGKAGLFLNTMIPMVMAILIFFTNGTDNVLVGLLAAAVGPILFVAIKMIYGGCSKNNLAKYPLNPKTRLGVGDMFRLAVYSLFAGAASLLGRIFLIWFESDWGEEYFSDGNVVLFSDYQQMLDSLNYIGAAFLAAAAVLFVLAYMLEKSPRQHLTNR